ncbi:MAG: hypothetical protein RIS59_442 [Pseudomonadota bacterium]|jgi:hypothetical protein
MRWMMSCREASRLTTEASYRPLGPLEHGLLVFHRSMCRNCRRFAKQMHVLDSAMRAWRLDLGPVADAARPPQGPAGRDAQSG